MRTNKPSVAARIKEWWRELSASQTEPHSSTDRKRLRRAGCVIAAGIAVGAVGAYTQWHPKFFFNALVLALIVSQGLIGACSLQHQVRWSYFLMVASLAVLLMSFAF
ncbi:hypothetical protein LDO32_03835 [Luteimonas sp. Y-2-2-4F]|nr:hypothetical protein [Luteimonas sp. Y-2-2-4F]MCD9030865.1 hypothetical protein [Luteimonas sp. Y-2-2-4F]